MRVVILPFKLCPPCVFAARLPELPLKAHIVIVHSLIRPYTSLSGVLPSCDCQEIPGRDSEVPILAPDHRGRACQRGDAHDIDAHQ